MPSWNIHTAHAERLLHEHGAQALGIRDLDSFLLGNLLPDIYVGYMVTDLTHKIRYEETHLARAGHVPEPNYDEFFRSYGKPGHDGMVSDLILGCWAHLVADHDYNHRVREVLARKGMEPSPEVREAKQADFDLFGRTNCYNAEFNTLPSPLYSNRKCTDRNHAHKESTSNANSVNINY